MKVFYLLINYYTDLHQRISFNKKPISSIMLICFYIQLLSVIVQPSYNNELKMKVTINIFNIFNSVSQIGRPYQAFLNDEKFRQYSFLIPILVIVLIQIIFLISQLQKFKGNKFNQYEFIQNSFSVFNSLENGLAAWLQIYYFAFNLYFLDLCSLSLNEQINQTQINIAFTLLIIICYIIVIAFTILNLFCQETLQFPCSPLKFENVTFKDALTVLITATSLIFSNLTLDWQHIVFRMMNCINIVIHIQNEVYRINTTYNFLALIILSSTFSYCITDFLFYFIDDQKLQIVIVLILCPFWTNILKKQKEAYCKICLDKKRNLQQIYNNLILLHQLNKSNKSTFSLNALKYILDVQTNEEAFQKELSLLNAKTIRCDKAKQIFWHKKFVIIQYSQRNIAETLCLIHNFKNNLFFMESKNQYIKVQLNLSYLQGLQLDHLKKTAQQNLYNSIQGSKNSIDLLEISDLIQKKIQSSKLIEEMYELFADKYSFYINILKNHQNPRVDLYETLYNLTERGLALQQQLKNQLLKYKTQMLQYMLVLINVEFFNNVLQAQIVKYSQIILDLKSDVFEKKEYLIVNLNDDLINLTLNSYSQKLIESLGYKSKHMVKSLEFDQLIPFEFVQTHQILIFNFLKTGKCKFFNSQAPLFVKGEGNIFFHCNAEIYLQPNINNEVAFYHFVQIIEDQPSVLIVNNNQQIVGYTEPLLKLFQQLDLPRLPLLYLQNINLVFMNFSKLYIDEDQKHYKLICMQTNRIVHSSIYNRHDLNYIFFSYLDNGSETYRSTEQVTQKINLPTINIESIVEIPKNLFDNINSPLSIENTNRHGQNTKLLQKSQSITEQKMFGGKSREGSDKISSADKMRMENNDKIIDEEKDQQAGIFNNDKASSKFSRGVLENSLFNDKYLKLNEYLNQKKASSFHSLATAFLLIGILTNLIFYLINTFQCIPQYESAYSDATILAIKSYFMTPIHDCITAQVVVVSYMIFEVISKEITADVLSQKKKFASAAINQSYVWLKQSFEYDLNNRNLEQFFHDSQISVTQIVNESLVTRNISLKNSLYYYLEASYYISIINYDEIFHYIPSNEFIYYISNIVNIDDYFDELNEYTLNLVITEIDLLIHNYIDLVLKFGMLNFIFITVAFCYVLKYYHNNKLYFRLLTDMNILAVQKEMLKLEKTLGFVQNERSFKDYQYELSEWERSIKAYEVPLNQKINQKRISSNIYHQKKHLIYVYFLAILITLIIPLFILQSLNSTFYTKYKRSSQFLKTLSVSSSAITALYELREINYMINQGLPFFFYFTDEKRLEQNVKVLKVLDQLNNFMQQLTAFNSDDLLCDKNFQAVYENIKQGNLCNFILHVNIFSRQFDQPLAQDHCKLIYSGVMELGLYNTVNQIYNQIMNEYQNTNGFEAKLRKQAASYEEAEIGLIASEAVLYIQQALFEGILYEKNQIVTLHQVIGGLFISLDAIFMFILVFYLLPYYKHQFQIVKQMILIVPSYQFYLDKIFESNFRVYKIQQT